jgi:hypothetical protein
MILGEDLVKDVAAHFRSLNVGSRAAITDEGRPSISLLGVDFIFDVSGRKLEVLIFPQVDDEVFSAHFESLHKLDTFNQPGYEKIRDDMNKSQYFLRKRRFYRDEEGYHFKCEFNGTASEDKIFYGLLSHVIRPVLMYRRIKG